MNKIIKLTGIAGLVLVLSVLVTPFAYAQQTADQLFPQASVSQLAEDILDRQIDVLWAYWPTILVVAVTIGIAYFLISKAMSAVRGRI